METLKQLTMLEKITLVAALPCVLLVLGTALIKLPALLLAAILSTPAAFNAYVYLPTTDFFSTLWSQFNAPLGSLPAWVLLGLFLRRK